MTFAQLEAKLVRNTKKILFDVATDFKSDVSIAPVVSGDLRRDWKVTDVTGGYSVSNNMIYASKIWVGKPGANTWQVPNGLFPIYSKYKRILITKIEGVNL